MLLSTMDRLDDADLWFRCVFLGDCAFLMEILDRDADDGTKANPSVVNGADRQRIVVAIDFIFVHGIFCSINAIIIVAMFRVFAYWIWSSRSSSLISFTV